MSKTLGGPPIPNPKPQAGAVDRRSLMRLGAASALTGGAFTLHPPQAIGATTNPPISIEASGTASAAGYQLRPAATARFNNPRRTILSSFSPGHGYGGFGGSSYEPNDTSDFAMGTQSAFIVTTGKGGQTSLTKTAAVAPVDMTGKIFAVLLKVTNARYLSRITLLAGNSNFAHNYQIQLQASRTLPEQEITPEGRWTWVTLPWSPSTTAGTPSRTSITDLRITAVDDGTGNPVKIQVQAIAVQPERPEAFPEGVVSIGFDDCWGSQRPFGTAYLDKYGFQPSIYVIVDQVGRPGRLSLADLHQIEEYSGGEVGGHAWTSASHNAGFHTLSAQVLDDELRLTKGWLLDNNFQGLDLFAYPRGYFTASVVDATARYFGCARTVNSRHQETLPPGSPMACRARSVNSSTTLDELKALVNKAQANGSWLNLLFHDITPAAPTDSIQVTQAVFQRTVDHIRNRGIPVRTTSQVLRATQP